MKNSAFRFVEAGMFRFSFLLLWSLCGALLAAEPNHEPSEATILKLIALRGSSVPASERVLTPDVRVAAIQTGTMLQGRFQVSHVRRVTTVEGVLENGSKVRRVVCREFYWSEEYGWFTSENRLERGGEAVWIWSEYKGQVVVR